MTVYNKDVVPKKVEGLEIVVYFEIAEYLALGLG